MNPNTIKCASRSIENAKQTDIFWEELAILGFTEAVLEKLDTLGLTRKELAHRMNVSPAYVTKLIGGSNNFTLRTMVKIARCLGAEFHTELRSEKQAVQWQCYKAIAPRRKIVLTAVLPEKCHSQSFTPTNLNPLDEALPAAA